jgi:hypothetical protein
LFGPDGSFVIIRTHSDASKLRSHRTTRKRPLVRHSGGCALKGNHNVKRRKFIATLVGTAAATALPLPVDSAGRMLRTFRQLRASREGLCPDIALSRMERTIADLRAAGVEIRRIPAGESGDWRPPAGFGPHFRCNWHEWVLAGSYARRKLRCLICEGEELDSEWIRNPFLMRSGFYRVV